MRHDVAAKLDATALADLAAERERHGRTVDALSHTDHEGLAAECTGHVVNVSCIMAAWQTRTTIAQERRNPADAPNYLNRGKSIRRE